MIIKIQMPQGGDMTCALIYNADRSLTYSPEVRLIHAVMKGRAKAYFHAELVPDTKNENARVLDIYDEAPDQTW